MVGETSSLTEGRNFMIANYHTHTWRCGHADGTEREYVECAIQGGLKILGFSDHTIYPFPSTHFSGFRIQSKDWESYVDTVLALKKEYQKDIEIHLGVEAEYYPAFFGELQRVISDYPVEYFLLGQHFLGNEIGEHYNAVPTGDVHLLNRYCEQVMEAMQTGYFTYFAHPDLIHFIGNVDIYQKQMRQVCEAAKACKVPLEINFLGIASKRHYPNQNFWKIVGEVGCDVVFGADAHTPSGVWNPQTLAIAEQMVKNYHLNVKETVDFRKPVH